MKHLLTILAALTTAVSAHAAELIVASFHPLVSDLARQVGGTRVQVIPMVGINDDPHTFSPTTKDLQKMRGATLILVSGKGLEPYLGKLRDNLVAGQQIVEVGKKVPSIKITEGALFVCCPAHSHGSIDPHWWHSPSSMQRAADILADIFAKVDPAGKKTYQANAKATKARLSALRTWAKKQLAFIPRGRRKLVTAHAAYGYFCKEFGWKSVPVQGLTKEREPTSKYLATTIGILKKEKASP